MQEAPLVITVHDGHWEAYGLRTSASERPSIRDGWLMEVIRLTGGFSDSLPDGAYYFNVVLEDDRQLRIVMVPKEDWDEEI